MNKCILAWAIWLPLVGCSGAASDNSNAVGGGGNDGASGNSSSGAGGACSVAALPADVQAMLASKCAACHGSVPMKGAPSLVSYANLIAPSSDPAMTYAERALTRIQSATMPPPPGTPATASDIASLQDFISKGYPKGSCATGAGGAPSMDPLLSMPTCTSTTSWAGGNRESASMNPGMACVTCHQKSGEAPIFSIAGTVYPTGHEPDLCNSKVGTDGARIVIIGADGKTLTLTPNAVGNFSSEIQVKTPFQAKVTFQGRERLMITPQTSGDCNGCHSQSGDNSAPGRVTVP